MISDQQALDYASYAALFPIWGLALSPAECHGGLAGLLCATDTISSAQWADEVLAERAAAPDGSTADAITALRGLYDATVDQLEDAEYGFTLLLPADTESLAERAEALSQWCQGFLWGLGLGGIQDEAKLPGDVNEVMRDMSEISRLNFATTGSNDDETAFAEIVEYVRMAVLLIYEELRLMRTARPDSGAVH